ncbi:MAG: 5-(carboxyamino)imidazole ribonucleotide synthase, partial [bacterium]
MSAPRQTPARHLSPGDTIGILGGGQLGRMLAMAAARLGLRSHVFSPEPAAPAAQVATASITAAYDDRTALDTFARCVDIVTFEFENVPVETLEYLAGHRPVHPSPRALSVAQDRLLEKKFLAKLGIATAPWRAVNGPDDIPPSLEAVGRPAILKTRRFGYDGKGQTRIPADGDTAPAWERIGGQPAILEGFVGFRRELSVVAARGQDGRTACYDLVENRHENHILARTVAPARADAEQIRTARTIAETVLGALDYVGVLAAELFECADGTLLVNEIAPRVHNSGHWTLDACTVSQFEQHVRAVAGWKLGRPERHSDAIMENLLGRQAAAWEAYLGQPDCALHLYGKSAMRPGRKMGHVTHVYPKGKLPGEKEVR